MFDIYLSSSLHSDCKMAMMFTRLVECFLLICYYQHQPAPTNVNGDQEYRRALFDVWLSYKESS